MPMIPRADARLLARDAVVLDLGDLARQGREIIDRAQTEAERIIEDAKAERQRLISDASERGYEEGFQKGMQQGRAEGAEAGKAEGVEEQRAALDGLRSSWERALESFDSMRTQQHMEAERGVLALAVRLGERVAKRAIELDAHAAVRQLEEAIDLALAPSRVRIRASKSDIGLVREALPAFADRLHESASIVVVEDDSLSHGSIIVEADQTEIDARIETQLARIVDALLRGTPS